MFRIIKDGLQVLETNSISVLIEWLDKHGDDYNPKEIDIIPTQHRHPTETSI